ncbi:hypothetical protein TNCV_4729311 [Trichonephila clavipes]|nr:hypothetical protein TNCV_4729311 [Trichonephila clavipes]
MLLQPNCAVFTCAIDRSKGLRLFVPTMKYNLFLYSFLSSRDVKPVGIHRQLVEMYGENVKEEEIMRESGLVNPMMGEPVFITKL